MERDRIGKRIGTTTEAAGCVIIVERRGNRQAAHHELETLEPGYRTVEVGHARQHQFRGFAVGDSRRADEGSALVAVELVGRDSQQPLDVETGHGDDLFDLLDAAARPLGQLLGDRLLRRLDRREPLLQFGQLFAQFGLDGLEVVALVDDRGNHLLHHGEALVAVDIAGERQIEIAFEQFDAAPEILRIERIRIALGAGRRQLIRQRLDLCFGDAVLFD